ncbi:MAG: succinate dehydrogenase, cytochrome b556 subunit [Candidatus Arsenophonus melophagi]|nr:succinate dehydrogenase, cytochrome b556 subunit [Candidatus Arsenophonus melophagi]
MLKKQKPINLQLKKIYFPITAVASILHRISGVIAFFTVGILLWLLELSLSSLEGFQYTIKIMHSFFIKLIMWSILTVLIYHMCSGIRHMLMDFGFIEETFYVGRISAIVAFIISAILSTLAGLFLW